MFSYDRFTYLKYTTIWKSCLNYDPRQANGRYTCTSDTFPEDHFYDR